MPVVSGAFSFDQNAVVGGFLWGSSGFIVNADPPIEHHARTGIIHISMEMIGIWVVWEGVRLFALT
jgi:hypothetical protein